MALKDQCCYSGRGKIYVQRYVCLDSNTTINDFPLIPVGNATDLSIAINETSYSVPNRQDCAGGTECTASFIDSVDVNLELTCWKDNNLALGFFGDQYTKAASTIAAEPHVIPNFIESDFLLALECSPVAGSVTISGITLVEGTDYEVTGNGILIYGTDNSTTGTITGTEGTAISVDYTADEQSCIPLFTTNPPEVRLILDGVNCVDGLPFYLELCRIKFKPADGVSFINGDEFSTLTLSGVALKDESKKGNGTDPFSQYGKIRR